jgi:hypothetical protein
MSLDPRKATIAEHQKWLGYLQPEGMVVSPVALADSQVHIDQSRQGSLQQKFLNTVDPREDGAVIIDFPYFARDFLGWQDELLSIFAASAEVPDALRISTGEGEEILEPTAAYRYLVPEDQSRPWLLLVQQLPHGTNLDQLPDGKATRGWVATPHQKFERLLRESGVPIGILCNGSQVRLVYAPKGENSGWITFPVAFLAQLPGRLALNAFETLLSHQRLISVPEAQRLPALLRRSRDYQANVSTDLAGQVLEALYELTRGFQAADEKSRGELLQTVWERNPQELYGGLISTLLRLVFLLYSEDRGLMPSGPLYQRNYSVTGLFDQLRSDQERYPDTMDHRFGGWPRLLSLFRAVYGGCKHRSMSLPARKGHLFEPDRYPFLEGRSHERDPIPEQLPRFSDGTLYRVLNLLLYLDGERLSYRTLDVEQIGSVYQTVMGFEVQKAEGRMIALKPKKAHGAPIHINLDELLEKKAAQRDKYLSEIAETTLADAAGKVLKVATTQDELLAALEKRIDRRATPHPVAIGSIILQPTDERRRTGSHYTPRSFTEPIVRKTLEPILDRLGRHPKPEAILNLKVADPAVGSAAFLVETCRQLADELVASWHFHKCIPVIPPDEDEILYARRMVAQRCLYGVDRNPMAVDLAKLSLWLTTMAKDHPFTFLDHSIRCGDALVGLTKRQIECFTWKTDFTTGQLWEQEVRRRVDLAMQERLNLMDLGDDITSPDLKRERLAAADESLNTVRFIGDAAVAAFFSADKDRAREQKREELAQQITDYLGRGDNSKRPSEEVQALKTGKFGVAPFHWEIEFPEIFSNENPGFDAIVGNPPYAGKNTMISGNREGYLDWLKYLHEESHGNADLVAHFFRRAFSMLRRDGAFGLIATNTIGQGDTRHTGLRWICSKSDGTIYAAQRRYKWLGKAAVTVSVVWVAKGHLPSPYELDGRRVENISAYLFHNDSNESPSLLGENSGRSFIGSYVLGMGFTFDDGDQKNIASPLAEMKRLIAKDHKNEERIFPYLGGEEVNDSPSHKHRRHVINFADFQLRRENNGLSWTRATEKQRDSWLRSGIMPSDYPEPVAADWPDLLEIVEKKVKPDRMLQGSIVNPARWYRFARPASDFTKSVDRLNLTHVLACCRVQPNWAISMLPATSVFAESIVLFIPGTPSNLGLLQSSAHESWARFFGSSLEDRLRYTPTDCFETFPFPPNWEDSQTLDLEGRTYHEFRAGLMVRNNEGLTKTYNRFHNPEETSADIQKLRELHGAMDRAVLDAYGWTDIPTDCEFLLDYEEEDSEEEGSGRRKKKPYRYRWPDEVRDEVLARLLALNAERHAEEVRQAEEEAKLSGGTKKSPRGKKAQREKFADELL